MYSWLKYTKLLSAFQDGGYGFSSLWGGYVWDITRKAWPWTIVCNVLWEWYVFSTLKTLFVDLEYAHCNKRLHVSSLPISPYISSGSQKSLPLLVHLCLISICICIILLVLLLNKAQSINQSINQSSKQASKQASKQPNFDFEASKEMPNPSTR